MERSEEQHQSTEELDPALLKLMQVKYAKAYQTAERIAILLQAKMDWQLNPDDLVYLTLHIFRVTARQQNS